MADIFISYKSSDRDWAFWIANELERLGHVPHVHDWEVKAGSDIYDWMERRHDAADHVLCVISDDDDKAPFSTLERNAALWQQGSNRPGFVLLVAVKACRLPSLRDHFQRVELFGIPEEVARVRLRNFMAERRKPITVAFPGKAKAVSNIPIRVPKHFLGREDALNSILSAVTRQDDRPSVAALYGLRGVGKSTLAAAFAESHSADYRATWWIRSQAVGMMRTDLVALGIRLRWIIAEEKEEPALSVIMHRLRHEGEGILLIYDHAIDADGLWPFLPPAGDSQILITSNGRNWRDLAVPIEINTWPKEIGADYLVARAGRDEREAAEALSVALGGLPLAHKQAGAYCERLEISFAEYQKRLESTPIVMLDSECDAPAEYNGRLTVARTFTLAIDEAVKLHPAAEQLIVHAALLPLDAIPLFYFSEARETFPEPLAQALFGDGLSEILAALRTFALVERGAIEDEQEPSIVTDTIYLHPLIRMIGMARREGNARLAAQSTLIEALAAVYPEDAFGNSKTWPRARRLDALASGLLGHDLILSDHVLAMAATSMDRLGGYKAAALADYVQSSALRSRSLAIRERLFGPDHVETASILNNLALVIQAQGNLKNALSLFERALAIREDKSGPNHQDTASILNNLGRCLHDAGHLERALPLIQRALRIREEALGAEDPRTIVCLNNLAYLLHDLGCLSQASPLFKRALAVRKKLLGRDPRTATSYNNLANLLRDQGELREAITFLRCALAIDELTLGPEHPDTAKDLSNLALLRFRSGKADLAEPMFRKALGISSRKLGIKHPLHHRFCGQYAWLLLGTGRASEALALAEAALSVHTERSGSHHPWTRDSACLAAAVLASMGRDDEAAELRKQYRLDDGRWSLDPGRGGFLRGPAMPGGREKNG